VPLLACSPRAILATEALTCERTGPGYVDHALLLMRDGKIEPDLLDQATGDYGRSR